VAWPNSTRKLAMANFGQSGITRGRPVLPAYGVPGPLAPLRAAGADVEQDLG
jgi:hypothetical protein